jgi:hypothetical protein
VVVVGVAFGAGCASGDELDEVNVLASVSDGGEAADVLVLPRPAAPTPKGADAGPTPSLVGDDSGAGAASEDAGLSSAADAAPPLEEDSSASSDDSSAPNVPDSAASSDDASSPACVGYAPPSMPALCDCDPAKHSCTPNGCYNGYYCELATMSCGPKPPGC